MICEGWDGMMRITCTTLLAAAIALVAGHSGGPAHAAERGEGSGLERSSGGWEFLPDFGLSGEAALVAGGALSHDAILRRNVELDFLRRGNLVLSFHWGDRTPLEGGPKALQNSFEYLGVGYDTAYGRLKGFYRHTCSQTVSQVYGDNMRWSEFGVGLVTQGARLGHYNDGIDTQGPGGWLLRPNLDLSLAWVGLASNTDYSFRARGTLREDLYRAGVHVLYALAGLDVFAGTGSPWGATLELGDRMLLFPKLDLTLFCAYRRIPDPYGADTGAANVLLAGTRLTTRSPESFLRPAAELPDLRITGSYATALNAEGSDADVGLSLGALRLDQVSLWGNGTISLQTGGDLVPKYVIYDVGPELRLEEDRYYLTFEYHYVTRHDANAEEVDYRRYHSLALGVATDGMDVRRWDRERVLDPSSDRRLPLNGSLRGGVFLDRRRFPYHAFLDAAQRWDALRYSRSIVYERLEARGYFGGGSLFGFRPEVGLRRVGRAADFTLYMNYQRNIQPIRWERNEGRLTIGVRFNY